MTGGVPQDEEGGEGVARDAPRPWEGSFALDADAVRRCRVEVEAALRERSLAPAVMTDALLVLGELVSNAVRHARTEFTVTVSITAGTLRLDVFDRDTRPPSLLGLDADSTSGRGLHIVAGIADDWGWHTAQSEDGVSGKSVWAELATETGASDPPGDA